MKVPMSIVVTIVMFIAGIGLFLVAGGFERQQQAVGVLYKDLPLKVNYAEGVIKIFAEADPQYLATYAVQEGVALPTETTMVLGYLEAQMMKEEKLITGVGSSFDDFFGIKTSVGGILAKTNTMLDDMHFLTPSAYALINGEEGRAFVVRSDMGEGKLFYKKGIDEAIPVALTVVEGDLAQYQLQSIDGKSYTPVLIGSTEAAMMREEKLFSKPGDVIDGFFGSDVYIAGILAKTGTVLDMMHISPFGPGELR